MLRPEPKVGKEMPLFTRPLTPSSARPAAASPSMLSPAMTTVSLVTLSCAALFLFVRPDGAQSLPGGKSGAAAHKQVATAKTTPQDTNDVASGADERKDLSFYTSNVRDGMFSQPVPPTPKPVAPPKPVEPPKQIIVPPMPVNPFAGWTYTGTVSMGDVKMALLENSQSKEGIYVKAGDSLPTLGDAKVKSISDQSVTLTSGPKATPTYISKSDTIIVTPLDQDAPGKNPQQQAPGQPQNGQQQINVTGQMGGNQFQMMSPNGMLSGDAATRYQNRLDRGFNRGNGGGGGGNNFGGGGGRGNGGGGGGRRGNRGGGFGG